MRPSSRAPYMLLLTATLAVPATGCDVVSRLKALAGSDDAGADADAAAVVVVADDAAVAPVETAEPVLDASAPAAKVAPVVVRKDDAGAPKADAGAPVADAGAAPAPKPDAGIPTPVPTIPIPTIPGFDAGAWKPPGSFTIPRGFSTPPK